MTREQAWREAAAQLWEGDSRLVHFYRKQYGHEAHRDFFSDLADLLPRLVTMGALAVWVEDRARPQHASPIVRAYVRFKGGSEATAAHFFSDIEDFMTEFGESMKSATQQRAILRSAA